MAGITYIDFYDPERDTDASKKVIEIYRAQFPALYHAADREEIRTSTGKPTYLAGETLITYRSAIARIYGKSFRFLADQLQKEILEMIASSSFTSLKQVEYWDGSQVINNHQIGNMMPFPSGTPSMNSFRADVFRDPGPGFSERERELCRNSRSVGPGHVDVRLYDYFDRFLSEVENFYSRRDDFQPETALQVALHYQSGYFDFFQTFENYIESNLLQDFAGISLWSITDFQEYLQVANKIIDKRGERFTVPKMPHISI